MRPLRLGLIGRGPWAANIAATLDTLNGLSWISMAGYSAQASAGLDGVLIANRSRDHAATALPFLAAGIPCFIEKPVAVTLAELEQLKAAEAASAAAVFVGHLHRFNPAALAFCAATREIGPLVHANGLFANAKPRSDTSVIWDWLPHPLSLAPLMFDAPLSSLRAQTLAGSDRPVAIQAQLQFGKVSCDLTASWAAPTPVFQLTVIGENGRVTFDDRAERKVILTRDGQTHYPMYESQKPLTAELTAFAAWLRGERANPSCLSAAETVMHSLSAIERSASSGGAPVVFDQP